MLMVVSNSSMTSARGVCTGRPTRMTHAFEFVARGTFNNQESIMHVSECPVLGCGVLLGKSVPAQNLAHRMTFRYLGKSASEPRVAAVLAGEPRVNVDDDLRTCENVRAALPHDPTKE